MWRARIFGSMVCAALAALVIAESEPNAYAPVLDMSSPEGEEAMYQGFIADNELYVSLVPQLKATDKDEIGGARFICGYNIQSSRDYEVPFEVEVINHLEGTAKLKLKPNVDLKNLLRQKYKFQISAFDCGNPTLHSEKMSAVVTVLRSPETKQELSSPPLPPAADQLKLVGVPEKPLPQLDLNIKVDVELPTTGKPDIGGEAWFDRPSYIVAMREATIYDSVLRLRPAPTASMANICGFQLTSPGVPFAVDDIGNVRNTKELDYETQRSYILSVVAKHCDGLVSKPAMINIQVSKICTNGWKELPTDQEYSAGSRAIQPLAGTYFDMCDKSCTTEEKMSVRVSLEADELVNSCEHDAASIQAQRESCGVSPNSLDLLPASADWTSQLTSVDGHDAAYEFDGKTAVKVPSEHSNHTLGDFFSIDMWMSHGQEKMDGHKEHILCNADGNGKNRHHYALFVHNCRLVFLLRKEAVQVEDMMTFQPAEWRWSIPHVCDSQWHHYSISVDYPNVKLFVDGQSIQGDADVLEIVDDWALHPTNKVHFTQLTVGACWQGATSTFGQYFDGALAGLSMVQGSSESERVVKCLNQCGEKLQFKAMDLLEVGMSVSFNTELTEITIRGEDPQEVTKLLRQIGYINTHGQQKPAYRNLRIASNVTCDGVSLDVIEQEIPILVSAVQDPHITLAAVDRKQRSRSELAAGADVFTELMIFNGKPLLDENQENKVNKLDIEDVNMMQKDLKGHMQVDRCEVRTDSPMNSNSESLRLPESLLIKYLLDSKEFAQGFDITGVETYKHYEEVIRETFYYNLAPGKSFSRKFTVKCSAMTGRYTSNELSVELSLISDPDTPAQSAVLYSDPEMAHIGQAQIALDENVAMESSGAAASGGSGAVVAVVVICSVLLVAIVIVAVLRIRSVQRRGQDHLTNVSVEDGPEMEWDNSTLNITVNPLESDSLTMNDKPQTELSDSEDELSDFDETETVKDGGLEWDSTLSY